MVGGLWSLTVSFIAHTALLARLFVLICGSPWQALGRQLRWTHRVTPFYYLGGILLFVADFVILTVSWAAYSYWHPRLCLIVLALLFLDWWWGGPGHRQRRKAWQTLLKVRQALAWGVPAKRPVPA